MKYYVFFIGTLSILFLGCKKESLMSFTQSPGVYVYKYYNNTDKDSLTYSFAIQDAAKTVDTIFIPLRILGDAVSSDRTVSYSIREDQSINIDPNSFELLPAIIAANSFAGNIPIKVKRSEAIKTAEMRLWVELEPSDDFELGPKDQLSYLVKLNDFLSKPNSWKDSYFGPYSRVKYETIINQTGFSEFGSLTTFELNFIVQTCKGYLFNYEQVNKEPLLDEDGVVVKFP